MKGNGEVNCVRTEFVAGYFRVWRTAANTNWLPNSNPIRQTCQAPPATHEGKYEKKIIRRGLQARAFESAWQPGACTGKIACPPAPAAQLMW